MHQHPMRSHYSRSLKQGYTSTQPLSLSLPKDNAPSGLRLLRGTVSPFESPPAAMVLCDDGGGVVCEEGSGSGKRRQSAGPKQQKGKADAGNVPVPVVVWVCMG